MRSPVRKKAGFDPLFLYPIIAVQNIVEEVYDSISDQKTTYIFLQTFL
jgi:hypothetical protein